MGFLFFQSSCIMMLTKTIVFVSALSFCANGSNANAFAALGDNFMEACSTLKEECKPENLLHKPNNAGRGLSALELCLEAHAMCQTMIQFDRPSDPEEVCREYLKDAYSSKEGVYCLTDRMTKRIIELVLDDKDPRPADYEAYATKHAPSVQKLRGLQHK